MVESIKHCIVLLQIAKVNVALVCVVWFAASPVCAVWVDLGCSPVLVSSHVELRPSSQGSREIHSACLVRHTKKTTFE